MSGYYTDPGGMNWPAPEGAYWGAPAAPDTGAPIPVPVPTQTPGPVNNKFGGFGAGISNPDPTGPALPPSGTATPTPSGIPDIKGAADRQAAAGGPPGAPELTPGAADRQPAMISQTTTDSQTTTAGVDKAGAANIRQAGADMNAAAQAAGDAQVQSLNDTAELERKQSQAAYGRGVNTYFEQAAAAHVQDQIINETTAKLDDVARFQPDRTALFSGDRGALFGISAAISAMAGGWLMGQGLTGGKNPYLDAVLRMIDDNAHDQIEANSQVYRTLVSKLGSAQAAKAEIKARMLGAVNDTIDAQARFDKSTLVQKGGAAVKAQVLVEQAKNWLDVEKAVAKNATISVQKRTQMVPNPAAGGSAVTTTDGKPLDTNQAKLFSRSERSRKIAADLRAKRGSVQQAVGFLDGVGNWIAGATTGENPQAIEGQNLISEMQNYNLERFSNSPGDKITAQKQNMGVPQRDSDIDAQIKFWDEQARTDRELAASAGVRIQPTRAASPTNAQPTGRTPIVRDK